MDARKYLAAIAFAAIGWPVMAQNTVADSINQMEAQLLLLKKQKELDDARASTASDGPSGMPRIVSVGASLSGLTARLLLPNGAVEDFREGDTVREGMKIVALTTRGVVITFSSGKKSRSFPLEYVIPQAAAAAAVIGVPGQPVGIMPRELMPEAPPVGGMRPPASGGAGAAPAAR